MSSTAGELAAQAGQLQSSIAYFKIGDVSDAQNLSGTLGEKENAGSETKSLQRPVGVSAEASESKTGKGVKIVMNDLQTGSDEMDDAFEKY